MSIYSKTILAVYENCVDATVYRDEHEIGRKLFVASDAGFILFALQNDTKIRKVLFDKAHKWVDEYIAQMKECEVSKWATHHA